MTLFRSLLSEIITPSNTCCLALGAVGAIVSYKAGHRVGEWIYDRLLDSHYRIGR